MVVLCVYGFSLNQAHMHAHHGKTSAVASTSSGSDRLKRPLDNDVMESEPAGLRFFKDVQNLPDMR